MTCTLIPVSGTAHSASSFDDLFEAIALRGKAASQGIVKGWPGLNECAVTGSSSPVTIATGAAIVKGKLFKVTVSETLAIPTPSTNPRIDRVCLQIDYTASPETPSLLRVAGVAAASPSAPSLSSLQVDGTSWVISLAQVRITTGGAITVTDERAYFDDDTVNTDAIVDDAVTGAKIADDAIDSNHYVDGSIDPAHLANGVLSADATGRAKMASGFFSAATVTDKFAAGSVTATEIANRTRKVLIPVLPTASSPTGSYMGGELSDAATEWVPFLWQIPQDYVSGLKLAAIIGCAASGNVRVALKSFVFLPVTSGEASDDASHETTTTETRAVTLGYSHRTTQQTSTSPHVAAGSMVMGEFRRYGSDALDTAAGTLYVTGIEAEYVADS